jgi:hypothetical protein
MMLNNLASELSLLNSLSHTNLLKFYGAAVLDAPVHPAAFVSPFVGGMPCVAMVTEIGREGSLEDRLLCAARSKTPLEILPVSPVISGGLSGVLGY